MDVAPAEGGGDDSLWESQSGGTDAGAEQDQAAGDDLGYHRVSG